MNATEPERAALNRAAKKAAEAMAELWDALRAVELAHNGEFDGTVDMVEHMAVSAPIADDSAVWAALASCWKGEAA